MNESPARADRRFAIISGIASVGALTFLAWLLVFRTAEGSGGLGFMPTVNAILNLCSAAMVIAGMAAIRGGRRGLHRQLMVGALIASALFLVGYVIYHYVHGDTPFPGEGTVRVVYLVILASHVILSLAIVPLVLTTVWLAATERFDGHRRIARVTLPLWLYVSVTGIIIYLMLHRGWGT